ncbi:MAG: hypothetical protein R3F30_11160 [Planctomycetota bacterium]
MSAGPRRRWGWTAAAALLLAAAAPAQIWPRTPEPDPYGGSLYAGPDGGVTPGVGAPWNNRQVYGGSVQDRMGWQAPAPYWGWIGPGQPSYRLPSGYQNLFGWAGGAAGTSASSRPSVQSFLPYGMDRQSGPRLPTGPGGQEQPGEQERGMPAWLDEPGRGQRKLGPGARGLLSDPARAFLLRMQDEVLVKPADEEAFYPLTYWDKGRVLAPGAEVRVVAGGRCLLVFPGGTEIDLSRPAAVRFVQGTDARLELVVDDVHTAHFKLGAREVVVRLFDGTVLSGMRTTFSIQRERRQTPWRPEETEDRLQVKNWGGGRLVVESRVAGGAETVLTTNRKVVLPAVAPPPDDGPDDPPLDLSMEGGGTPVLASIQADLTFEEGDLRVGSRVGTARLRWGGCDIRLGEGQRLRIDPMGGRPFGEALPAPRLRTTGAGGR